MPSFHAIVDDAVPSLRNDLVDSWGRQKLQYKSKGKLITIDFNPQQKLSRTAKRIIRTVLNQKADREAEQWAKEHSLQLIKSLDESSRQAVKALLRGLKTGTLSPTNVHSLVGEIVGLTDRNANTLAQMIASGKSREEIAAHTRRLLQARGQQIASHEMLTAGNMGLQLAYEKGLETGVLKATSRKVWRTENDTRVCAICRPYNRKQARIDQPFQNGLLTPPAHVGCRCYMSVNIGS